MPNVVQTLRSLTPGARPTGKLEGEVYANFPDRQLGVIDDTGAPLDLVAVRYFSETCNYVLNDFIVYQGRQYNCIVATTGVGPFDPKEWSSVGVRVLLDRLTLHVRATGDDTTGDGSLAKPWLTLQRCADFLADRVDANGFLITVTIGAGTFKGARFSNFSGGSVYFLGAGIDVTIIATAVQFESCFNFTSSFKADYYWVSNMTLKTITSTPALDVSATPGQLIGCAIDLTAGGQIIRSSEYFNTYSGLEVRMAGQPADIYAAITIGSGVEFYDQAQWTLTGAPNGFDAWLTLQDQSTYTHDPLIAVYPGVNIVGKKYKVIYGSHFHSNGAGTGFLPGDQPGMVDASSYYDGVQGTIIVADAAKRYNPYAEMQQTIDEIKNELKNALGG